MAIKQIPFSIATNIENFLSGIAIQEAKNSSDREKAVKKIEAFITGIESDIREVYDKYIPNVLVANPTTITNIIVNRMTVNPEQFLDSVGTNNLLEKFNDTNGVYYRRLYTRIDRALNLYHRKLLSQQNGVTNPIRQLNDLSVKLFNRTRKIDNAISARVLGIEFASNIKTVFGNKAILAAIEPGLGDGYVFFSSSFNAIGAAIRENVYSWLETFLRSIIGPLEFSSSYKSGAILNIGHAALINDVGAYVNSPAFAKAIYSIASGRSKIYSRQQVSQGATFFKKESKIIENSITVSRDFTGPENGYAALLSLGITFTNFEDSVVNQSRGRTTEKTTLNKIVGIKKVPLTRTERKRIIDTLVKRVTKNNPHLAQGSKSLLEFINYIIISNLAGKRIVPEKSSKKTSVKFKRVDYSINPKYKSTNFVSPNKSTKTIDLVKKSATNVETQDQSIVLLQNLLNNSLVEQIKQNMGNGNRRDILNLRTGRFAESVKITNISRSRQGMITAFYTYMRNPYATFSVGGKQQYPRSRDPKLLISKSIRDIAKQQMIDKIRAIQS